MWHATGPPLWKAITTTLLAAVVTLPAAPTAHAVASPEADTGNVRPRKASALEVSNRPLTGVLGLAPPFSPPPPDPAVTAAAVQQALARQRMARRKARRAPDPEPAVTPIRGAGRVGGFGATSKLWKIAHSGIDFSASSGTEAVAVVSGKIRAIFIHPAFGNVVELERADGVTFWYCHLSSALVEPGDRVRQGQPIALVGSTGNTTGPHLHFEVRVAGVPTDPAVFLYENPGVAASPPSWAFAYGEEPPPGFTVIGYPPPKKDPKKDDEVDKRKPAPKPKPTPVTSRPRPNVSPSPSRPAEPDPSPSPTEDEPPEPAPSSTPNTGESGSRPVPAASSESLQRSMTQ